MADAEPGSGSAQPGRMSESPAPTPGWPKKLKPMSDARSLIIDRGDLAGLTAVAIADRPDRVMIWCPLFGRETDQRCRQLVQQHAHTFGADGVECAQLDQLKALDDSGISNLGSVAAGAHGQGKTPGSATGLSSTDDLDHAVLLLLAAGVARRHHCGRIVWPIQFSESSFDDISRACEQTVLLGHLIELSDHEHTMTIETPFLDLADKDLVDLAVRSSAALSDQWLCIHDGATPCGGCAPCLRWSRAFADAQIPWPWSTEPAFAH